MHVWYSNMFHPAGEKEMIGNQLDECFVDSMNTTGNVPKEKRHVVTAILKRHRKIVLGAAGSVRGTT